MIKAIIFDMDGVIIDSEPLHSLSLERLLRAYGKNPILNEQGTIHEVGPSGNDSYVKIIEEYDIPDSLEEFRKKRRIIFEEIIKDKLKPAPGFLSLINKLKKSNYLIGLASNRFIKHVLIILENLEVKDDFDVIVGPSDNRRHKPFPDIYLDAAKEFNLEPKYCVAIEDTETGIISAKEAGMKVIAVPNKYTSHQDFSRADIIFKSLNGISLKVLQDL